MKKNVFVVDDHTAIREGFRAILERSGAYAVAGEAASAEDLLARLDSGEAAPELFIVDVSLPGMGGIELVRALRSRSDAPVVVLSMHRRYDYMAEAFRAGASGYVAKDAGSECIVAALAAASAGGCYCDPASLRLFIDEVSCQAPSSAVAGGRAGPGGDQARGSAPIPTGAEGKGAEALSEREAEVLRLLAEGLRAEEIARRLGLSRKTVENHLSNITIKLGAHNRFELYRIAARM